MRGLQRALGNQATLHLLRPSTAAPPSPAHVQRVLKDSRRTLRNGVQILQYLISAYPDHMTREVAEDLRQKIFSARPYQLRAFLRQHAIPASVDEVLAAAGEALLEPMLGQPAAAEPGDEPRPPSLLATLYDDIPPADQPEPPSDTEWLPGVEESEPETEMVVETPSPPPARRRPPKPARARGQKRKGKRASAARPSKRSKTVDPEAEARAEAEAEAKLARRLAQFKPSGQVPLVLITWNIQKYSASTNRDVADTKRRAIATVMNVFHPSALILQEVTNPGLLLRGAEDATIGLLQTNLFAFEPPVLSSLQKSKPLEQDNPLGLNQTGQPKHYPLAHEFASLHGPVFHSRSGNYQESYPLLFDPTQVVSVPQPYIVKGAQGSYKLEAVEADQRIDFSSHDVGSFTARPRPLLVWKMEVQTEGYQLRPNPPAKTGDDPLAAAWSELKQARSQGLASGELRETQTLYLGVVHTSPSNELGIELETRELLLQAAWLKKQYGDNVVLGGDWYMERESPAAFDRIARGTDWQIGAAPQGEADTPHALTETKRQQAARGQGSQEAHKFLPTSLPKKDEHRSQTADFFVLDTHFNVQFTSAISLAPSKQATWFEEGNYPRQPMHVQKDLFEPIESVGIDHLAVITVVYV